MELIYAREIDNSIVDLNIIKTFKSYNFVLNEVAETDNYDNVLEIMPDD